MDNGLTTETRRCDVCGATVRLGESICVSCFLNQGLQADREGSAEIFERILAEADVADTAWRIGNYQVIKEIGRGGMGAVFLARRADEQYQKQVAIKLIKRGMDTDSVLRHFRNERQILAAFDHPNIARLYDGGTTDTGLPYFVMEYVEGLPIDEYCEKHNLSTAERLTLFRQVCGAVSYAHRHLVIHRDIKRSNVLITADGVPKLLDFGIAKILQQGDGAESMATMTGMRLMTPEYASPEQLRGEPVTTATDVYSLGVVLYELLTGQLPYRVANRLPNEIARAVTDTEPQKPSTAGKAGKPKSDPSRTGIFRNPKHLRGDLDNIVLMALRKEPERRYQSVEQFSNDIRRHLQALPVIARRDTVGYRAAKFVRRNKVATAAATVVFLTLIGGIVATTWQAHRATSEKLRAERRFNEVRQLAHSVLFDYHDAIKNLPGATQVRERLLKDGLTYLDRLAHEASGDPALQRELAAAYERLGDVRGETYTANLGDRAGAADSYMKALKIREALVATAPRDVENRRALAASYRRIGNQLRSTAETAHGRDDLRRSIAICSELTTEHPANDDLQRELGESCNSLGLALESDGDMPGALDNHRRALNIYGKLLAKNPASAEDRRALSRSYENIGRALFLNNDPAGALDHNQKALGLRQGLVEEDPTNADYQRILGVSYQNNGDYNAWLKNIPAALESFRKKLQIDEASYRADPANIQARDDLGYCCARLGDLLAESGDREHAIPYYQRALELREKAAAADPQDLEFRYAIAAIRAHLADALAKIGNVDAARDECEKTATDLSRAVGQRLNVDVRRSLVIAGMGLGDAYSTLAVHKSVAAPAKYWQAARDNYQYALDIFQDLRRAGAIDAEEIAEIDKLAAKVAECDTKLKDNR